MCEKGCPDEPERAAVAELEELVRALRQHSNALDLCERREGESGWDWEGRSHLDAISDLASRMVSFAARVGHGADRAAYLLDAEEFLGRPMTDEERTDHLSMLPVWDEEVEQWN